MPRCVFIIKLLAHVCHLQIAVGGYALYGMQVQSPITEILDAGWDSVLAQLVLLFHVLIGYAISANALNKFIFTRIYSDHIHNFEMGGRLRWFGVTLVTCAVAYLVAEVVPAFSDFVNLQGSTVGVFITYNVPSACYLRMLQPTGLKRVAVHMYNAFGIVIMLLGTVGTLDTMAKKIIHSGVFLCS